MKKLIILLSIGLAAIGCEKDPGVGGNAAIKGVVMEEQYNDDFSILKNETEATNHYVYIRYGDDEGYGDRVRTAYDGSFYFNNLNKGDYSIYTYSEDPNNPSVDVPILKEVSISGRKDVVDVGTLTIKNNDIDGNAIITGIVRERESGSSATYLKPNERVFIVYDNKDTYETFTRTSDIGRFEFDNLPVGEYRIYVYSTDSNEPSGVESISKTVTILTEDQEIDLGEFIIIK